LGGAEIRNDQSKADRGYLVYGYNDDVLTYTDPLDLTGVYPTNPDGSYARIPANTAIFTDILERNLSYFGNASYTYAGRYILSASSRWDASNLFGVKTNQKGVPLWSAGLSWDVSKEPFWPGESVRYLRLRTTYGVNGNVNRRVSALPTISISSDYITPNNVARITGPGNPNLRWEKVTSFNAGVDFGLTDNRMGGIFCQKCRRSDRGKIYGSNNRSGGIGA
jgi:TonB-dependent starch-binding outer membrane protein SusC